MKIPSSAVLSLLLATGVASAQDHAGAHKVYRPQDVKWGPGPASLPKGAQAAVLYGDPTKEGVFAMRPAMTQAEADQTALANLNRRAMSFITGEGVARGHTDLRSGTVIKIDGVGERFSGQYYVTSAVHRYNPQQSYQTHFMIRRNSS